MKILNRILLPLVVAFIAMVTATSAMAQGSTTWMPGFNPDRHVYIDPKLEDHGTKPVSLPNLPAEIERAQKVHNLKVYVVATEQGSESQASSSLAAQKLDELVLKWRNDPNFPVDDYLVIMWVRFKDDPARGSVAANGGNRLRGYGLSASHFSSDSGPVIPVLKQHMRERPELALTSIIGNVNDEVTRAIAAEQSAKEREEALKELPDFLLKWGSLLAGLALVIFVCLRFSRARSRALRLRNRFENDLDNVNQLVEKLKTSHGKFLSSQRDWQNRFKGTSLDKLKAGFTAFSELLSVSKAASNRLADSDRARRAYWFPRVQGSLDAIKLLSETEIVVSSKEIDLEMATLFGGLTINKTVDPDDVFANGNSLYQTAEDALNEIERSIKVNDEAVATVRGTIAWVAEQNKRFEEEGLTLAPYQKALDHVVEEVGRFEKAAFNEPLAYILEVPGLTGLASTLKESIEEAFALADKIEAAGKELNELVKHAEHVRSLPVEYKFFGSEPKLLNKKYRLAEEGGDPDPVIQAAAGKLMKAFDLLHFGAIDQAEDMLKAARLLRDDAEKLFETVFAAKAKVETDGALYQETQSALEAEIKGAFEALSSLKSGFLRINFPDADPDCDDANSAFDESFKGFAGVKEAYDAQMYLKAADRMATLLEEIAEGRRLCQGVVALLASLTSKREESRKFVPEAREHLDRLGPVLKERSFTTASATDADYAAAVDETAALEAIVPQPVADWVDAHTRATALKAKLVEIETACDDQLRLYNETYELVGTLPADVESAFFAINANTLQPAIDAHKTAVGELEALCREVDKPKSDWKTLHERAVKAHEACAVCRTLADRNDRQHQLSALHLAYCKVRSRRFSRRKHKYLTEANRLYAEAQTAFAKRDWEGASRAAVAAYKEFLKFDRHQKRRTATLVVKGAPGASSSAPSTAAGSTAASDDGFSTGIAIAIGMSMGSGNPQPTSSGSSSSSSSSSSNSTPSYTSTTSTTSISIDTGGGSFGGGSGGGGY
jgi:hypothetical protein